MLSGLLVRTSVALIVHTHRVLGTYGSALCSLRWGQAFTSKMSARAKEVRCKKELFDVPAPFLGLRLWTKSKRPCSCVKKIRSQDKWSVLLPRWKEGKVLKGRASQHKSKGTLAAVATATTKTVKGKAKAVAKKPAAAVKGTVSQGTTAGLKKCSRGCTESCWVKGKYKPVWLSPLPQIVTTVMTREALTSWTRPTLSRGITWQQFLAYWLCP